MLQEHNYEKFKILNFNRVIEQGHVNTIKQSIKENGYIKSCPILVDKKFNIIDGQHRFIACQQLKLPIYYEIIDFSNNKLIIDLNTSHKNWGCVDYINYYAEKEKNENYIKIRSTAKMLKIPVSLVWLLSNHSVGGGSFSQFIQKGTLIFTDDDANKAYYNLQFVNEILKNIRMKNCSRIARAILELDRIKNYKRQRMLEQTKNYSTRAYKCQSYMGYVKMFIDIYNYNAKSKNNIINY